MNILILTSVLSRNAGGLHYSVPALTKSVSIDGYNVSLMGFKDQFSDTDEKIYSDISVITYKTKFPFRNSCHSFEIRKKIKSLSPAIIHQQGIWSFLSWYTLRYKRMNSNCKTIITTRGMLDPWIIRRSPVKKWIVRKWFVDENFRKADCIHALCKSEYNSIRKYGLKNPVAIIPNGTNIPKWTRDYEKFKTKKTKTILFLSRLHPKKGVLELIDAYAMINESHPDITAKWHLKIGGWGDVDYIGKIKDKIRINRLTTKVELLGSVYGEDKDKLLKEVDAFILPTYSEGLPMAVLEAWAYGLPVITTEFANLPEGFEHGASFEISTEPEKMSHELTTFLSLSDDIIIEYGKNGYTLSKNDFSWEAIGKKVVRLYEWLLGNTNKPEFVYD